MLATRKQRTGAAAVEAAIVLPVFLLFVMIILSGGMAVFRHQQTAWLAREAARYASVRAGEYEKDSGNTSPLTQAIIDAAVTPYAVGMETSRLTVTVEYCDMATGVVTSWDAATKDIRSITTSGEYVSNVVRVTVSYEGLPSAFGVAFRVGSTSELPLSN